MFRDQKSGSQKVLVAVTHTGDKTDFFKKKMEKQTSKVDSYVTDVIIY